MNTAQTEAKRQQLIDNYKIKYPEYWVGLKQRKASKGYDKFDWKQEPLRSRLRKIGVLEIVQNIRLFHHDYTMSVYWLFGGDIEKTKQLLYEFNNKYKVQICKRPEITNS